MAEETATVRLDMIECPPNADVYHPSERQVIWDGDEDLALVSLRVRCGRDAFPIRVILDRREVPDDRLLAEARRRALVMLRAAIHALEGGERPGEAPQSLGGLP